MARYVPDPARRIAVFLGEAGCGKSELSVHWALQAAAEGKTVSFFDLDQTKPLMRSRDVKSLLESAGVSVRFEHQTADAPTQVGGLVPALLDEKRTVILDVGGNDTGARLIGGCAHLLKSADAWFVVNPYRPWSGTVEHIDGTLSAVLRAARLGLPRFLLNPSLGAQTTAEEFLTGLETGLRLLSPYVTVEAAAVTESLLPQVESHTELPLIPITPRMSVPAAGLDEEKGGIEMAQVTIRAESCKSCGYCVKFCPKGVLAVGHEVNSKGYPFVVAAHPENCIGCAICGRMCPDAAIEVYR